MKRKYFVVLLAITMVFTLAVSCDASGNISTSVPNHSSTAHKSTDPPKATVPAVQGTPAPAPTDNDSKYDLLIPYGKAAIDGVVDDAWKNAAAVELEAIKEGSPDAGTKVKASAMWDEEAFYFLFEITDHEISQKGSAGDWKNDGIYLYISESMDDDCTAFADFLEGTYQFALINKELSKIPRYGEAGEDLKSKAAYQKTDNGMIIEFSYQPVHGSLKAGTKLYLDYQYNDCNDAGRLGALGWYNDSDINAEPALWGMAKLMPKAE